MLVMMPGSPSKSTPAQHHFAALLPCLWGVQEAWAPQGGGMEAWAALRMCGSRPSLQQQETSLLQSGVAGVSATLIFHHGGLGAS